jgi:hypothetical protein
MYIKLPFNGVTDMTGLLKYKPKLQGTCEEEI